MKAGSVFVSFASIFAAACAVTGTGAGVRMGDMSGQTFVRLTYTRPLLSSHSGRPDGFEIIHDYKSSDAVTKYEGIWTEETQTLSDQVAFPVGSVNLIFVVDEALTPGSATPITASREGRLHEVPCPRVVNALRACYELTVTKG